MSFADELNNMPSGKAIADRKANQALANDLEQMLNAVRSTCIKQRSLRHAEGYIVRNYDIEYSQHGCEYLDSLVRDNKIDYPSRHPKGTKLRASLVSDEYYREPAGRKPISKDKGACQRYIPNLRSSLEKDGLEVLCLESFACYNFYDLVKYTGFISPKPILERHKSDVLLGFVVKFAVRW